MEFERLIRFCRNQSTGMRNILWNIKVLWKFYEKQFTFFFSVWSAGLPITFLLGFYVTLIVRRWWEQYTLLPWPGETTCSKLERGGKCSLPYCPLPLWYKVVDSCGNIGLLASLDGKRANSPPWLFLEQAQGVNCGQGIASLGSLNCSAFRNMHFLRSSCYLTVWRHLWQDIW